MNGDRPRQRTLPVYRTRRTCDICGERSFDVRPGLARVDESFVLALDRCRDRDACAQRAEQRATAGLTG